MVDNSDNNPSSTTANDPFHSTSLSLARQAENEGEMRIPSESVDMSTRKYGVSPCWLHTRSSSALPAIRTVYAFVAKALQSSRGDGKLWQRKRRPRRLYTLLEIQPIASREYISFEKPVFNIGLMPLLLENAHATALLNRVMNLVKKTVEHLNPNETPVLTMDQPLFEIAKKIQWLWSDSFSNNKYVIMTGVVTVGSSCWDGLESGSMVLGGQVQSQLQEDCCRIFYESILSCEDKTCPQVTAAALHILQQSAFLSYVLSLIMLSAPNSDKHRMET